jgi:hypothetical protein
MKWLEGDAIHIKVTGRKSTYFGTVGNFSGSVDGGGAQEYGDRESGLRHFSERAVVYVDAGPGGGGAVNRNRYV